MAKRTKSAVNAMPAAPKYGQEIASISGGNDITRGYIGPLLQPTDSVLRTRSGGNLALYGQVYSDAQVKSVFGQRQLAVTKCDWKVEAASEDAVDVKAADWLRQELVRIAWDDVTTKMLFGVFYGYSVAEMIYEPYERTVRIAGIRVRDRRRFRFDEDAQLRLLTPTEMLYGIPAEKPYFWHFATGADNDDEPYGQGLAHWLYWPTLFKRQGIKFWLRFLDKFGSPTAVGRYDPQNTPPEERSKLLAAVAAVQNDAGLILPKGMEIELMEAARSGAADYNKLHDTMDATIAKVVLGQTASSQGTPGKLGNDELQGDVRRDLIKADADLVCESFNLGPVRWLTAWNFPTARPPRVYRDVEEPEDLKARSERDERIGRMGFKPKLTYVQQTYGGDWVEAPAAPVAIPGAAPTVSSPKDSATSFAAPVLRPDVGIAKTLVAQAHLDKAMDALPGDVITDALDPMLAPVIRAIQAGSSPEDAYEQLIDAAPDMDDAKLQERLARAMFVADLWGQLTSQSGRSDG